MSERRTKSLKNYHSRQYPKIRFYNSALLIHLSLLHPLAMIPTTKGDHPQSGFTLKLVVTTSATALQIYHKLQLLLLNARTQMRSIAKVRAVLALTRVELKASSWQNSRTSLRYFHERIGGSLSSQHAANRLLNSRKRSESSICISRQI